MDLKGWMPLDLLIGGVVTAGVAYGVYKIGFAGRKGRGSGAGEPAELDGTHLQDCIALAGQPSDLGVCLCPQSDLLRCRQLATNLRRCLQEGGLCSPSRRGRGIFMADPIFHWVARSREVDYSNTMRDMFHHLFAQNLRELQDMLGQEEEDGMMANSPGSSSNPSPTPSPPIDALPYAPQHGPSSNDPPHNRMAMMTDAQAAVQLAHELNNYRLLVDKWMTTLEAKVDLLEEQRLNLTTQLHVTREALQVERRCRAEAEEGRYLAETLLQEMESRAHGHGEDRDRVYPRIDEVQRLERQVENMEEQLEQLYRHNVVTSRTVVLDHTRDHEHLASFLEDTQNQLQTLQQMLQESENEVSNLNQQFNKLRRDMRQLSSENTVLRNQIQAAKRAARSLVALVFERSAGRELDLTDIMRMVNAPDSELQLDRLLDSLADLFQHVLF